MRSKSTALLFAAGTAGLLATAARADCVMPGFNPSGVFCSGCRYEGIISMSRGEICERAYFGGQVEISSNRIVQRAKHGIAGASVNKLAYAPAKGFVGEDDFVVEANYRLGNDSGKFTVHFRVTVK